MRLEIRRGFDCTGCVWRRGEVRRNLVGAERLHSMYWRAVSQMLEKTSILGESTHRRGWFDGLKIATRIRRTG